MDATGSTQNLAFLRLQRVWDEQRQRLTAPFYGQKGFLRSEVRKGLRDLMILERDMFFHVVSTNKNPRT